MTSIHPKKLLLTKWTAVKPVARQKHFLITKVVLPEILNGKFDQGAPDECAGQSLIGTKPLNWSIFGRRQQGVSERVMVSHNPHANRVLRDPLLPAIN